MNCDVRAQFSVSQERIWTVQKVVLEQPIAMRIVNDVLPPVQHDSLHLCNQQSTLHLLCSRKKICLQKALV
jgi:hypothetical protein